MKENNETAPGIYRFFRGVGVYVEWAFTYPAGTGTNSIRYEAYSLWFGIYLLKGPDTKKIYLGKVSQAVANKAQKELQDYGQQQAEARNEKTDDQAGAGTTGDSERGSVG